MKIKNIVIAVGVLLIFSACKKNRIENNLIGTWEFEYEILDEGSKDYDLPYALMDFGYNDGFILNEDGTGSPTWYGEDSEGFEWSSTKNKLIIYNRYWAGELTNYEFSIKNVKRTSLTFENYKGHKYYMKKK
ncbi:MAG: hypothetical protein ACI8ZM_001778 [Crocinitomix sp.]|jgi:hypothetical protein